MTTTHQVNWYGDEVRLVVRNVGLQGLVGIAFQIVGHAKANIVNNDQVDTGFMVNSGYVVIPNKVEGKNEFPFENTWPTSTYKSKKTGRMVKETRGPKAETPNQETVVVVFGAEYSIFQELRKSFLMKAVEQAQGEVTEAEIQTVAKRRGLRG